MFKEELSETVVAPIEVVLVEASFCVMVLAPDAVVEEKVIVFIAGASCIAEVPVIVTAPSPAFGVTAPLVESIVRVAPSLTLIVLNVAPVLSVTVAVVSEVTSVKLGVVVQSSAALAALGAKNVKHPAVSNALIFFFFINNSSHYSSIIANNNIIKVKSIAIGDM